MLGFIKWREQVQKKLISDCFQCISVIVQIQSFAYKHYYRGSSQKLELNKNTRKERKIYDL